MFRKSNIYALCNVLLVCILIGITTAINRVPNNNHNSKNRKNLGRNKNFAFSLLEGKSFQFSRNKHYSGRGSKGGSTEEGKKKKSHACWHGYFGPFTPQTVEIVRFSKLVWPPLTYIRQS